MVRAGRAGDRQFRIHASVMVLVAFGLAACDGAGTQLGASRAGSGLELTAPARAVDRDIPAPEVFDITESGLWDGRPSLGGVWVAHPTARDPERVIIRNAQSGEEVIGALFRRERENPGPRFQISSEAAQALGILAGQPATLTVTALRLQRIDPTPAALPAAASAEEAPVERAAAEAPAPAPAAVAAAPTPSGPPQDVVAITSVDPEPERPRGFRGLFRRDAPAAGAEPGISATALAPIAPVAEPAASVAPVPVPVPVAAVSQPVPSAATSAPMASTPLLSDEGAAQPRERRGLRDLFRRQPAEAPADPTPIPLPEPTAGQAAPVPERAPAPPVASAAALSRPFVQIGIFSVEDNATRASAQMRAAGLPAEIRPGRAGEREFWRVVVGPAADGATHAEQLRQVRGLGFADAYAVAR